MTEKSANNEVVLTPKAAAIITIRNAQDMTDEGRKQIATWLRRHANFLVKYGNEYSKIFTGRYLYNDD